MLHRGRLFAGRLFAGQLFGPHALPLDDDALVSYQTTRVKRRKRHDGDDEALLMLGLI